MTRSEVVPKNNHEVILSTEEIERLKVITHKGTKVSAKTIVHANILLNTNDVTPEKKKNNRELAEIFSISPTTVNQIRKTYTT